MKVGSQWVAFGAGHATLREAATPKAAHIRRTYAGMRARVCAKTHTMARPHNTANRRVRQNILKCTDYKALDATRTRRLTPGLKHPRISNETERLSQTQREEVATNTLAAVSKTS
jgi:hypothetical protein